MELRNLIREIHWIEWQLRTFEDKYGVLSRDFYQAMEAGQLSEFDDGEDPRFHDFLEWHGLYKIWLKFDQSNLPFLITEIEREFLTDQESAQSGSPAG